MELKDKYIINANKEDIENKEKLIISNDAYALGEIIQDLTKAIKHIEMIIK